MDAKSARRAQMRNGPFPKAGRTPKVRWAAGSGLPARVFLGVLLTVKARQEISSDALHRVYVRDFSQVEFHSVMTLIHFICRPEGLRADEARDTTQLHTIRQMLRSRAARPSGTSACRGNSSSRTWAAWTERQTCNPNKY